MTIATKLRNETRRLRVQRLAKEIDRLAYIIGQDGREIISAAIQVIVNADDSLAVYPDRADEFEDLVRNALEEVS